MEDILFGNCCKGGVVDTVMGVETFVLGVDKSLPEYGVHLFIGNGCTVLTEEFPNGLAVSTVDD